MDVHVLVGLVEIIAIDGPVVIKRHFQINS
jgi:hypothetical protein